MENQSSLRPKVERAADLTSMPPNANKLDKKPFDMKIPALFQKEDPQDNFKVGCLKKDIYIYNYNTSSRSALLLSDIGYLSFGLALTE